MKRRCLTFFTAVLMLLAAFSIPASASSGNEAVKGARNGVVRIVALYEETLYDGNWKYVATLTGYSSGSGFGVGDAGQETDVFVTNRHVVTMNDGIDTVNGVNYYAKYQITGVYILRDNYAYNTATFTLDPSRAMPCTVVYVGNTEDADIAILRAAEPVPDRVALPLLGDEDSLEQMDSVSSLGYPGMSDKITSEGYLLADLNSMVVEPGSVTRTYDSTSAVGGSSGEITGHLIQHSANISPGNSGGPLVNHDGAVVGINTYTVQSTNNYYAIRIKYAKDGLDSLGIPYDLYGEKSGLNIGLIIGIAAVVAGVAAVVVIVVMAGKKKGKSASGAAQTAKASFRNGGAKAPQRAFIRSMAVQHNGMTLVVGGDPILVGRDAANCKLVYAEGTVGVSGRHCSIAYDAQTGEFILTDLRSTYGTFLMNGQRLNANVPYRMKPGDSFYVGDKGNVIRTELG